MTTWLKQSTATDVELGPFVDDTDGKTPETGLTLSQADCQLIKNGGAAAQKNNITSATHLAGGHYKIPLDATDTGTIGRLRLYVNESGALPVWRDFMVVPANVYDSLIGGSDELLVETATIDSTTLGDIADAVWDENLSGHTTANTAGKEMTTAAGLMGETQVETTSVPASTASLADKVNWMYALLTQKRVDDGTGVTLYESNGTTPLATRTITDDGNSATLSAWTDPGV